MIAQGIGNIQGTTTAGPQPNTSTTTTTSAPTTTSTTTLAPGQSTTTSTSTTSTSTSTSTTLPPTSTTTSTSTSTSTTSTSTSTSTTTAAPTTTSTSTTSTSTSTSTTTAAPLPIVTGSLSLWTSYYDYNPSSSVWVDRSGNGNTALISGSTMFVSGSGIGQSLGARFNGTNNFLTYPATLGGGDPTTDWTVQMYGTWNLTDQNLDFFAHNDYTDGWDIALTPDGRTVVRANPSPTADFNYTAPKATLTLVTVTFDGTNSELKLYANTTLIGTNSETIANWNVTNLPFQFGWNANTDATFFAGTVREITLYKKVLTSGEITTNYNVFTTQP